MNILVYNWLHNSYNHYKVVYSFRLEFETFNILSNSHVIGSHSITYYKVVYESARQRSICNKWGKVINFVIVGHQSFMSFILLFKHRSKHKRNTPMAGTQTACTRLSSSSYFIFDTCKHLINIYMFTMWILFYTI